MGQFEVNNEDSLLTRGHIHELQVCKFDSPHNTLDLD
jgi:hypothetical protein